MTFNEIYLKRQDYIITKLLCPLQNNLIIVTGNVKQCGAQINK